MKKSTKNLINIALLALMFVVLYLLEQQNPRQYQRRYWLGYWLHTLATGQKAPVQL